MKHKTYLTPGEQLTRSMALAADGPEVFTGVISRNTRDFRKGDIVFWAVCNGGASRFMVAGVSSKGRSIADKYFDFHRWSYKPRQRQGRPAFRSVGPNELRYSATVLMVEEESGELLTLKKLLEIDSTPQSMVTLVGSLLARTVERTVG